MDAGLTIKKRVDNEEEEATMNAYKTISRVGKEIGLLLEDTIGSAAQLQNETFQNWEESAISVSYKNVTKLNVIDKNWFKKIGRKAIDTYTVTLYPTNSGPI